MTFVNEKELGLSSCSANQNNQIKKVVLEKLSQHELILADFNWVGYYDPCNLKAYLDEPYRCNAVIEIRLDLNINIISSRDAIYDRCLAALRQDEIFVKRAEEFLNTKLKKHQSLITFDMIA